MVCACRSPSRRDVEAARGYGCWYAAISMTATRSGGAPGVWDISMPQAGPSDLWKLPALWMLRTASTGTLDACYRAQASTAPTGRRYPSLNPEEDQVKSGHITCQTGPDRSLVNNIGSCG